MSSLDMSHVKNAIVYIHMRTVWKLEAGKSLSFALIKNLLVGSNVIHNF